MYVYSIISSFQIDQHAYHDCAIGHSTHCSRPRCMEHTVCKQILDRNEALLSATCNTKRHAYPLLLHAVPVVVCELAVLGYH